MNWTSSFFLILTLTISAGIASMIWLCAERVCEKKGYVPLIYGLFCVTIVFHIVPLVYIAIVIGTISGGAFSMVFQPTPTLEMIAKIIAVVWCIGMVVKVLSFARSFWGFHKIKKECITATLDVRGILEECCERLRITRPVSVCQSYKIFTPLLHGFRKPVIFLPAAEKYTKEELECIFYHELMHYLHKDIVLLKMNAIATGIHWFNPFTARMMRNGMDIWCEAYCDEAVCGVYVDRALYYKTLLKASESKARISYFNIALSEEESSIVKRIERMERNKKLKKCRKSLAVLSAVLFFVSGSTAALAAGQGLVSAHEDMYDATMVEVQEDATSKNTLVEYSTYDDFAGRVIEGEVQSSNRASNKYFEWDVAANTTVRSAGFWRSSGGTITVALTVTPSNKDIHVGIVEPGGLRRYIEDCGTITHDFALDKTGTYYLFVENINSTSVSVDGFYN